MILVFGGTTEGRQTIQALEEAGTVYYYSTKTGGQDVTLHHGRRTDGALDVTAMLSFCREHAIRLLIDAAHPFAEELHRNLLSTACQLDIPVIRFERIYPPHTDEATWCHDYDDAIAQMEAQGISSLLALTGVNTIGRLRPFWQKHDCWFRILNRQTSHMLAHQNGFPKDRLVYYESNDTATLLEQLHPQAIITKESGLSGGFSEKVAAARQAGMKVFVVERPLYPPVIPDKTVLQNGTDGHPHIVYVNGEHGLRRTVEKLLPEFFPLHSGLTTGTCATAAAVADALRRFKGEAPAEVPVILPNGETIPVSVHYTANYAYVIKDSGDDPDVTKGIEIRAAVRNVEIPKHRNAEITILGGEGVGRFTLPGFDFPPGEPAINRVPREMIRQNLSTHLSPLAAHLQVIITVPEGEATARRTFNPRLGITGGISIVGVSGIIKPFSEEAFIDSIRKCMQVAKASGTDRVVINSGAKSERFMKALYPTLPSQAFVEYGNYIGETLRMAHELRIPNITLGVMLGKAVKLAEGQLDTHSKKGTMNKAFIAQMLKEAIETIETIEVIETIDSQLSKITLARELWEILPDAMLQTFADVVIGHCEEHCQPLLPNGRLTILLISDNGTIYRHSKNYRKFGR